MSAVLFNFCIRISAYALVGENTVHQIAQQQLRVISLRNVVQGKQVASQHLGSLDQVNIVPAVSDCQGCCHSGRASADDQRAGSAAMFVFVYRL